MQKLSGIRGLLGFRSLIGSTSTAVKATNPKPSSDAGGTTSGSFANLMKTEEKLVKEKASVKTDLEMAHTKLRRATEHIYLLVGKLQQAVNENAKLKVKQTEESKKQYDLMLEGKLIEQSKNLKELSLKNDQAISDICKKYELEKIETTNAEKQKAEKLVREMENKCNEKISENKKDSESYLMHRKKEHGAMVTRIQQDNEHKESTLWAYHKEELQRIQSQAENELRERLSLLRKEDELQIKSLRMQHEEECRRLQEELKLQKSKEEKQRALLLLQWKVMEENQQVDQEVNSKKEYFVSSIKRRDPYGRKEHELQLVSPETKRKDVDLSGILQSPISNMLRKVENESQDIPKHRKVTHRGYKVETANRRITKCRKTRSTVMFGEPNTERPLHNPAYKVVTKMGKISGNTATIMLDQDKLCASRHSYQRGIRKVRTWCRANGIYKDLSNYFGPGAEVYTTPANGTFHLMFVCKGRKLTFFIHGRDLYLMGWKGDKGTFEIQSKKQEYNYIRDPSCIVLKTGVNYHDLIPRGAVGNMRIGPFAMMDFLQVLHKCNGVMSSEGLAAIAMFAVNISEAIRFQDVLEEIDESYVHYDLARLDSRRPLSSQVKMYKHFSYQYLRCVDHLIRGEPLPDTENYDAGYPKSLPELMRKIRVPLRDSYNKGIFAHEERPKSPVWCPPCPDSMGEEDWAAEDQED